MSLHKNSFEKTLFFDIGSQVRVPLADGTVVRAPDDVRDIALVLMADIFPTGYFAAANGFKDLSEQQIADSTVVVLGCGPVGKA